MLPSLHSSSTDQLHAALQLWSWLFIMVAMIYSLCPMHVALHVHPCFRRSCFPELLLEPGLACRHHKTLWRHPAVHLECFYEGDQQSIPLLASNYVRMQFPVSVLCAYSLCVYRVDLGYCHPPHGGWPVKSCSHASCV